MWCFVIGSFHLTDSCTMVLFFSSLECSFLYLWNGKFLKCRKMIQKVLSSPAAAAKLLQSCPTLCDPIDGSPPGSAVPGILQARTLEWVAICFSNAWKWKVKVKSLSRVWLCATPWTAAHQVPPSMGFSRQEYWSGLPFPSPGDLPDPGIEPKSLMSPALADGFFTSWATGVILLFLKLSTSNYLLLSSMTL